MEAGETERGECASIEGTAKGDDAEAIAAGERAQRGTTVGSDEGGGSDASGCACAEIGGAVVVVVVVIIDDGEYEDGGEMEEETDACCFGRVCGIALTGRAEFRPETDTETDCEAAGAADGAFGVAVALFIGEVERGEEEEAIDGVEEDAAAGEGEAASGSDDAGAAAGCDSVDLRNFTRLK